MVITLATPMADFFTRCGYPSASNTDVEAWNSLDVGDATAVLKLGLFGYDISCVAATCAAAFDFEAFCATLEAKGIDGLAFGHHTEIDASDSSGSYYCIGFRDTELGDNAVCSSTSGDGFYLWALEGYTFTNDWFTSTKENVF